MSFIKKILKKIMPQQNYENYWKVTLAYTNFNGNKFRETLQICVDFIDEFHPITYDEKTTYKELESRIQTAIPKLGKDPDASNRKAINQMVKLGFIEPFLTGYHKNTKEFLEANSNRKRKTVFSKIVYSNAKFNSSVTNNDSWSQMNFLIKTLEEVGYLSAEDIIALMIIDISEVSKGFVNRDEIDIALNLLDSGFIERKYNQIDHFKNVLGKLDEIVFVKNNGIYELYFTEDAKRIFGEDLELESKKRDPYLHLLYKIQLFEESESLDVFNNKKVCFLEKLEYPILIASHIKPFIEADETEEYDHNNGLLLSRTIDSLFDGRKGKPPYISFNDDGSIIFSERLAEDVKEFWKEYQLENIILNDKRKEYLAYHRALMTEIDANA